MRVRNGVLVAAIVGACVLSFSQVSADSFSSTSYKIDASVATSSGGAGASSSYKLITSTGENTIGNGTAGSYKVGMGYIAQLDKSLQLSMQPSGLVAAYRLDETSGTKVADDSTYDAYGTVAGSLTSVAGKLGTALSFDGSTQAITAPSNSQTQLSSTGTVEVWVKSTNTTGSTVAVSKASSFWLGLGGGKATTYDWTSGVTTSDSTIIADGNWHHIAITIASGVTGGSTLYVDGVAKKTFTWTPASQNGTIGIGAVYSSSTYSQRFIGSIDHAKVFNRALADYEIVAEYNAGLAGSVSGVGLGVITPGMSNTALTDIITQTDAGGYNLSINQDHDLSDGSNTISAISGSIASPIVWSEGTTKGLGFTLTATNATAISGVWGGGAQYAALPTVATTFYTRTGIPAGKDYLTLRLRADAPATQAASDYSNTITVTGTMTP